MTTRNPEDKEVLPNVEQLDDYALLDLVAGGELSIIVPAGTTLAGFAAMSRAELETCGFGSIGARRVLGAFELARRARLAQAPPAALSSPEDAYACVGPLLDDPAHEHFVVVVLDVRNRPRRVLRVAQGSVDRCAVDPRDVFAPAIREHGTAVLVAHNHPSGDPTPSFEDIALTQRLARAGEMLGLPVLDHLIVGSGPYVRSSKQFVSLAEMGILGAAARRDEVAVRGQGVAPRTRHRKKTPTVRLIRGLGGDDG